MIGNNCPHPEQCAEEAIYLTMAAPHKKGWWSLHGPVVNDRPAPPVEMFKGELYVHTYSTKFSDAPFHGSQFVYAQRLSLTQRLVKWWKS